MFYSWELNLMLVHKNSPPEHRWSFHAKPGLSKRTVQATYCLIPNSVQVQQYNTGKAHGVEKGNPALLFHLFDDLVNLSQNLSRAHVRSIVAYSSTLVW